VGNLKYLGTALKNQNSIQEEIKNRLKPGNAGYHSVQNVFFFQFAVQKFKD
jgi:flagellar basal body-associated protein FliL